MENKIPTAEEFFDNYDLDDAPIVYNNDEAYAYLTGQRAAYKLAIEFAKLHVKAALEAASEKAVLSYRLPQDFNGEKAGFKFVVTKDSILSAYPEENIK